jgi:hypothetical protein
MIPSKHARSLYFTPRTPWGRLPQNRPAQNQNYLRASETAPTDPNKKPDLSGKELQGLAGGMAPNQFGGSKVQGGHTGPNSANPWDTPHLDERQYPQPAPQPDPSWMMSGKGPLKNPEPTTRHYDLFPKSEEQKEREERDNESNGRFRFDADGTVATGENEFNGTGSVSTNKDGKETRTYVDPGWQGRPISPKDAKAIEAENKDRTFQIPPAQIPQNQPYPNQQTSPSSQSAPFAGTFTPRVRKTPPTDETLRPSPKWFSQSGQAPAKLRSSLAAPEWPPEDAKNIRR